MHYRIHSRRAQLLMQLLPRQFTEWLALVNRLVNNRDSLGPIVSDGNTSTRFSQQISDDGLIVHIIVHDHDVHPCEFWLQRAGTVTCFPPTYLRRLAKLNGLARTNVKSKRECAAFASRRLHVDFAAEQLGKVP